MVDMYVVIMRRTVIKCLVISVYIYILINNNNNNLIVDHELA